MMSPDSNSISGNPVIRHKFTSDPAAMVYDNKVYLYTGHDEAPIGVEKYVMNDWLCFSSSDLVNWTEHPVPLKAKDFKWAKGDAYASQIIFRNGNFYWYAAVTHAQFKGGAIGVAVAEHPAGPFRDARGSALVTNDGPRSIIDPAVILDNDGQAYLFWGKSRCYYAKLNENMTDLEGPAKEVKVPGFMEGVHVHRRNGWYYLSYGFEFPEKVAYAMSRSINGPWEFKGILNELAGNCQTNRPAIVEFKGRSYFMYHNGALKNGGSHRRSVCIDHLYYNADDTMKRVIMTSEGVSAVN